MFFSLLLANFSEQGQLLSVDVCCLPLAYIIAVLLRAKAARAAPHTLENLLTLICCVHNFFNLGYTYWV